MATAKTQSKDCDQDFVSMRNSRHLISIQFYVKHKITSRTSTSNYNVSKGNHFSFVEEAREAGTINSDSFTTKFTNICEMFNV